MNTPPVNSEARVKNLNAEQICNSLVDVNKSKEGYWYLECV